MAFVDDFMSRADSSLLWGTIAVTRKIEPLCMAWFLWPRWFNTSTNRCKSFIGSVYHMPLVQLGINVIRVCHNKRPHHERSKSTCVQLRLDGPRTAHNLQNF